MFRSIPYVACAMLLVTAIMAGCAAKDTYAGGHGVLSFNGGCVQQFNGGCQVQQFGHVQPFVVRQFVQPQRVIVRQNFGHHGVQQFRGRQQVVIVEQFRGQRPQRQRLQFGGGNRSVQRSRSVIRSR